MILYCDKMMLTPLSQLTSRHRLFTLRFYHGKHNDTRHRRSSFANLSDNSTPAFPNRSMKAYDTLNSKTDKLNHLGSFSRIHYYYFIKKKIHQNCKKSTSGRESSLCGHDVRQACKPHCVKDDCVFMMTISTQLKWTWGRKTRANLKAIWQHTVLKTDEKCSLGLQSLSLWLNFKG